MQYLSRGLDIMSYELNFKNWKIRRNCDRDFEEKNSNYKLILKQSIRVTKVQVQSSNVFVAWFKSISKTGSE